MLVQSTEGAKLIDLDLYNLNFETKLITKNYHGDISPNFAIINKQCANLLYSKEKLSTAFYVQ